MSNQKQKRLLKSNPDIVIATPGRLWDLCQTDSDFAETICNVKYLVLDEADRMLQAGHFKDLENILTILSAAENNNRSTLLFSATLIPDFKKMQETGKKSKKTKTIIQSAKIISENGESLPTLGKFYLNFS